MEKKYKGWTIIFDGVCNYYTNEKELIIVNEYETLVAISIDKDSLSINRLDYDQKVNINYQDKIIVLFSEDEDDFEDEDDEEWREDEGEVLTSDFIARFAFGDKPSFEIIPNKGIEGIEFYSGRGEIEEFMGYGPLMFSEEYDDFGCLKTFYDNNNELERIEFFENSSVFFKNNDLMEMDAKALTKLLKRYDSKIEIALHEFHSTELGIYGKFEEGQVKNIVLYRSKEIEEF